MTSRATSKSNQQQLEFASCRGLKVQADFRGDSGFCRWRMLNWCDANRVDYVAGLARNAKVTEQLRHLLDQAEQNYEITSKKQRLFT